MTHATAARKKQRALKCPPPLPHLDPLTCSQPPPDVLPDALVQSVMLRLEHAIRWANWPMATRILQDARAIHHGLVHESRQPIEERPIEALTHLAGLPNSTVYALRAIRGPAGPLQSVQDLLDYGQLDLSREPWITWQQVERVYQAIEHARLQIDRQIDQQACWVILCQ